MKFKVGDKVRVLDGSKIEDYTGGWSIGMEKYIGKVGVIEQTCYAYNEGYKLAGFRGYIFDERGLERVTKQRPRRIIIEEKHGKVTARLGNYKVAVEAESLETGAKDALNKLLEGQCEFKVGDVVEGTSEGRYCITTKGWIGRVTEIYGDGIIEVYGEDGLGGYHKYDVEAKHFKLKVPKKD